MAGKWKLHGELLLGAWRELVRLRRLDTREMHARRSWRLAKAVRDAGAGIIAVGLQRWLGRVPTGAERKAASRALADLEAAGKLTRLYGDTGTRVVAVRLPVREHA